jgi:hypothetical protein
VPVHLLVELNNIPQIAVQNSDRPAAVPTREIRAKTAVNFLGITLAEYG